MSMSSRDLLAKIRKEIKETSVQDVQSRIQNNGVVLLDAQVPTPHLASLGATEVPRVEYLARLKEAIGKKGQIR